jgi:hypothetical protein
MQSLLVNKNVILALSFVVCLGLASIAGYYFFQYQKVTAANQEIERLVKDINKIYELPQEQPTLATVNEKEKLNDQAFFAKAENGDKVLIFAVAQKAVLYRPSTRKLIEVAPFITQQTLTNNPVPTPAAATNQPITVTLFNGTGTVGVTNRIGDDLDKTFTEIDIKEKETAKKSDYQKTLVFDITGQHTALAQSIAEKLKGEVVTAMPEGETKPGTDLLVVVGSATL